MARWRGIFGRKGKRKGEPEATPAPDDATHDPVTALYPTSGSQPLEAPAEDTGDWEPTTDEPGGPRRVAVEPDTGTAEWAPPSRVDSRRPAPEAEAEVEPEPEVDLEPEPEPESAEIEAVVVVAEPPAETDTGERIQVAADEAARAAEIRSHDEILALERNLEQARAGSRAEIEAMTIRLREADARARQAEERADRLAIERDQIEDRAREQATRWLRQQVIKLKAEAQERVRQEVERIKAESPAGGAGEGVDAEALRSELQLAREEVDARVAEARDEGRREADGSDGDIQEKLRAARAAGRSDALAEIEADEAPRRRELEEKALLAAAAQTDERIARIQADADERIRAEVAVARKAAEDRFTELLGTRERELQKEREDKAAAIERSHQRLTEIESRAVEAADRVGVAEKELEAEKVRLREESAAQLGVATEQANAVAEKHAAERMRDREEELEDALAAAAAAEKGIESKVAEAERRADEAEERSRAIEAEAAATISEVRQSAADWLRAQTGSSGVSSNG